MARALPNFNLSALQFLCIDGDTAMRDTLVKVLRAFNATHIVAVDGMKAALDTMKTKAPDIIFCEWELPDGKGTEFVRGLRRDRETVQRMTPVIFVTAHTQQWHVTTARDAGVTEYLAKPFSAQLIYSRICAVLERPRAFIDAAGFVGPDRRRKHDPYLVAKARRSADVAAAVDMSGVISEDEIEAMLGL